MLQLGKAKSWQMPGKGILMLAELQHFSENKSWTHGMDTWP